jgi:hypothetical protein
MQNTRLIGITFPGSRDPNILLERWGRKVSVKLPEESLSAIRQACFIELPVTGKNNSGCVASCGYNVGTTSFGTVQVEMSAHFSELVSSILSSFMVESVVSPSSEDVERLKEFALRLKRESDVAKSDSEDWYGGENN